MEVTFGLLSFISAFVLSGWGFLLLIKLQIKNEIRLTPNHKDSFERNGCFTLNGLLTRFLWIVLIVSILWLIECVFTFQLRLWSSSVIDATDHSNKNNEHDVSAIVIYFALDLMALVLLLILYYILSNELRNIYDLKMDEQQKNNQISDSEYKQIAIKNAPTMQQRHFHAPSKRRERKKLKRNELRRQSRYERSPSSSRFDSRQNMHDEFSHSCSIDLDLKRNVIEVYRDHHSGTDGDNEDETETQFMHYAFDQPEFRSSEMTKIMGDIR